MPISPAEQRRDLVRSRIALVVGSDPLRGHDLESLFELPRGFVVAALKEALRRSVGAEKESDQGEDERKDSESVHRLTEGYREVIVPRQ
jgi:hypothetical protein